MYSTKSTLIVICLLFLFLSQPFIISAQSQLTSDTNLTKTISSSEKHSYTFTLENGMALIGESTQQGIDLAIDIKNAKGNLIKQFDSKSNTKQIDFTAPETGTYTLLIHSLSNSEPQGTYTLQIEKVLSLNDNALRLMKKELPTTTLFKLWRAALTDNKVMDSFLTANSERHIIEPIEGNDNEMLVTYFCIPPINTEYVMLSGGPDFLGLRFQRLPNTSLHFVTQKAPSDARFNYGFNYFTLDKAGPKSEIEVRNMMHAYDGTLVMPSAPPQNFTLQKDNKAKGEIFATAFDSQLLGEKRKVTIHTPANYNSALPHYLLIIFDGEAYGARPDRYARIPTPIIMDNLMDEGKIPPTITVMVWSMGKRNQDLVNEQFGDFIATELLPWVRNRYNIYTDANKIILAGSSRGGFAASYTAFKHADVIGNVLSQSGSYWIKGTAHENHWIYPEDNGLLIDLYKQSDRLPIRFYMDVGLYDAGASMLGMNRQFRDILEVKGYTVDYREFKGGHSYVNWRGTLSDGLVSLIGNSNN